MSDKVGEPLRYREALATWREATSASLAAQARVRASVQTERSRGTRRVWMPVLVGLGVAAAAAFALRWEPTPAPVALTLDAPVTEAPTTQVPVSDEIVATVGGLGAVTGDAKNVHVAWEKGTLSLEVEPERGIQLAVQTDEATVRVVGTGFDVVRDALGTHVSVRHGKVAVACEGGDETLLGAGEARSCLPRTAGGLLGRARALQDRHASNEAQLAAVELGLARASAGPVRDELQFMRLELLIGGGRYDDARSLARSLAEAGSSSRQVDVLQSGLVLALQAKDCADAATWAARLDPAAVSPTSPLGERWHAVCPAP